MKILMVCLGNICRSPLAEGILKHKVEKAGLDWKVDSAGTNGYDPGCPPHRFSQKIAMRYGIDIAGQKCRHFTADDMRNFDRIYVMDKENYYAVEEIAGKKWDDSKVDFLLNELYPGQDKIVPDPWAAGEKEFDKVYQLIDKACEAIIEKRSSGPEGRREKPREERSAAY